MNLESQLQDYVDKLSSDIGERNFQKYTSLLRAAGFIRYTMFSFGYEVQSQDYQISGDFFSNLSVELTSHPESQILVMGAHYDSFLGSPGANDNASAVAILLTLAQRMLGTKLPYSLRFVAFVNEEPPFFRSSEMGSYVYAKKSSESGENICGMMCLDTVGFYSDERGSQKETWGKFPDTANFIAFVGPGQADSFIKQSVGSFKKAQPDFPVIGYADFDERVSYVNYSDHWPFNTFGWPSFMVTDTGPLRYSHYHQATDTPDRLDYRKMSHLVLGLESVLKNLDPSRW